MKKMFIITDLLKYSIKMVIIHIFKICITRFIDVDCSKCNVSSFWAKISINKYK